MSNQSIVVVPAGEGFSISIPAEALKVKQDALAKAAPIIKVSNADEQKLAISAAASLKGLASQTEAARKAIKQPYWDAGQAIDAKAAEYKAELIAEAKRIEGLVEGFQTRERERAEEARLEQERKQAEIERAAQAERDRMAALQKAKEEAEAAAANATTKKAREAAAAEARRLEEERQEAEIDAMEASDAAAEAAIESTVVVAGRAPTTGAATSFTVEFEVSDIEALYNWDLERRRKLARALQKPLSAFPSVVKMELKKSDFKFITSNMLDGERESIPGVKFKRVTKVAVRGTTDQVLF